ncbi:MAG TPA: DUF1559 domain-containing protein [Pirellulales bacterium]|nr:DUF1559 domain-containing protein [Pirellulales bacterium]
MDQPTPAPTQFTLRRLMLVVLACSMFLAVIVGVVRAQRESSRASECINNSKQIGLGLRVYHDVFDQFPAAYLSDAQGQPLHSWRPVIIPYSESTGGLTIRFQDFEKAWNDPANLAISNRVRPHYYYCPSDEHSAKTGGVNKVMVAGVETAAPGALGRHIADFRDGAANTIFVAEIADSDIHWTEPRDLEFDKMSFRINDPSLPSISGHHSEGAAVMMADGSVRFLSNDTDPSVVRALLTVAGGERAQP